MIRCDFAVLALSEVRQAILWRGGEAEPAREAFRTSPAADRAALLAFLRSL